MKLSELKNRFLSTQRGRQFALCGTIIGAALLTSASIFATGPSATPNAHVEKAWPVSVAIAQPDAIRPNFAAFGRLEANRTAHLRSDLVARIDQVHVQGLDRIVREAVEEHSQAVRACRPAGRAFGKVARGKPQRFRAPAL